MPHRDSNDPKPANVDAIDSRRLQVFLEAARSTSFSTAAQVLGMVPSAVSHAVKALEEEFQCSLFKRHGPRVTLTKAGIRLLPLAEELLQRMTRLREEIVVLKGRSHHLRVMMPEMFCSLRLPRMLPDFMECFPSAVFEIASGDCDGPEGLDALDSGEIDLLISYRNHDQERVVKRELFSEELGFFVAPFHTLASTSVSRLQDIGGHPLLVSEIFISEMIVSTAGGTETVNRIWQLPSTQAVHALAAAGQGVAVLPRWAAENAVDAQQLTPLEFKGESISRSCAIYRSAKTELGWSAEVFSSLVSMNATEE